MPKVEHVQSTRTRKPLRGGGGAPAARRGSYVISVVIFSFFPVLFQHFIRRYEPCRGQGRQLSPGPFFEVECRGKSHAMPQNLGSATSSILGQLLHANSKVGCIAQ